MTGKSGNSQTVAAAADTHVHIGSQTQSTRSAQSSYLMSQVVNYKLFFDGIRRTMQGHSEPRCFKMQRRRKKGDLPNRQPRGPVVMYARPLMVTGDWQPRNGFRLLADPSVFDVQLPTSMLSFMPHKTVDIEEMQKTYEGIKGKMRPDQKQEWELYAAKIKAQQDKLCGECAELRGIQRENRRRHTDSEAEAKRRAGVHSGASKRLLEHLTTVEREVPRGRDEG